mmetsp:Transcript_62080/g.115180  ORF Transcript_62080/g.115180 Transcript_62080/m.115180 type:complete len:219 (+) Transcript_62080:124-780(+)
MGTAIICCCQSQEVSEPSQPIVAEVVEASSDKFLDEGELSGELYLDGSGSTNLGEISDSWTDCDDNTPDDKREVTVMVRPPLVQQLSALRPADDEGDADDKILECEAPEIDFTQEDILEVKVEGRRGKRFGIYVAHQRGAHHLDVVKVLASGLIPQWNKDHPGSRVEEGYQLLAVNGTRVQPWFDGARCSALASACQGSGVTFVFRRMPKDGAPDEPP